MMGGDVTVTSELSKGSVFTVRLPVGADTLRCSSPMSWLELDLTHGLWVDLWVGTQRTEIT
jgi:hypothetical protein